MSPDGRQNIFEEILRALHAAHVRYVVVGGVPAEHFADPATREKWLDE